VETREVGWFFERKRIVDERKKRELTPTHHRFWSKKVKLRGVLMVQIS